jgi:hypothetical protein
LDRGACELAKSTAEIVLILPEVCALQTNNVNAGGQKNKKFHGVILGLHKITNLLISI